MSEQLKNFGDTTLNGSINNSTTSVVVTDATVFPSGGNFHILIDSEIMLVTGVSSNTLTVVRGQESTTAASHSTGVDVKETLTKETFESFFGDRILSGGYSSRPASGKTGQVYYANDIDLAWRYSGSNWDLIQPAYVPYANRVDVSTWTALNGGSVSSTNYNGVLTLATSSTNINAGYYKSIPTAPFTANLLLRVVWGIGSGFASGMFIYDGTKFTAWWHAGQSNVAMLAIDKFNSVSSFNSQPFQMDTRQSDLLWLRFKDDNTNWHYAYSWNGIDYVDAMVETRNTFLTATQIGIIINRSDTNWPSDMNFQALAYWETTP